MNQGIRVMAVWMLAATMAACGPSQSPDEPEVAQPAESMPAPPSAAEPSEPMAAVSMPATPAASTPSGSMAVYACDDGSGLTVTYDEYSALVKLPTGSTMLSRAESVSNGGDEAYLGEELSLYRNGNIVQLQGAGKSRICTQAKTGG
jgi:hypothetical protein